MNAIKNLLFALAHAYSQCISLSAENATEAWNEGRMWAFLGWLALLLFYAGGAVLMAFLLVWLIYEYRLEIIKIFAPIGLIWLMIASYRANHPRDMVETPTEATPPIDEVRARAERTYPIMRQTAYLLLNDLCQYLNGLIPPFSLAAVMAPVNFDITVNMAVLYHFFIGKGNCDASADTLREILENLIDQHLRARDLPLTVQAVYVSADGSTWPSLVVDGVYDLGQNYRVDLVITNEAEVSRLKARNMSRFDDGADTPQPHDPDFS